jgi:hypothetical protein
LEQFQDLKLFQLTKLGHLGHQYFTDSSLFTKCSSALFCDCGMFDNKEWSHSTFHLKMYSLVAPQWCIPDEVMGSRPQQE